MRNLIGLRDLEYVLPIEAVYAQFSLKNPNVLHHGSFFYHFFYYIVYI